MRISRHFTTADQSPYAGVNFTTIDIDRPNTNPAEHCCVTDFEVPAHWSEQACETLVTLYARHSGVPNATTPLAEEGVPSWLQRHTPSETATLGGEVSVQQIFHRIVGAWTYAGWHEDYFDTPDDARAFYDEWCYMLMHHIAAPSSAQWMHCGLNWAYGMTGSAQGHWHHDGESGEIMPSTDSFTHPQLHANFIQGVGDELVAEGGILDLWTRESRAFKYGATTGSNLSAIRAEGERLSNGEVSPGLINFLSVGDRNAGAIHARSADKRTSKLCVVDMDHPDIPAYLRWKMEEETKAAAMLCGMQHIVRHVQRVLQVIEQARDVCDDPCDVSANPKLIHVVRQARRNMVPESVIAHTLGRAAQGFVEVELPAVGLVGARSVTQDVSAHHSNLAVRIHDDFIHATAQDDTWELKGRADTERTERHSSAGLLFTLAEAIWASGAPSLQFADNINRAHTCSESGEIRASNPSGESLFLDDTATPLAALNALAFVEGSTPNYDALLHAVKLLTLQLDITTGMGQYPSKRMAQQSLAHRPIGLSLCNLSGFLMVQGIAYDSDAGRNLLAALTGLVTGAAYHYSVELAKELDAFPAYGKNKYVMKKALQSQAEATFAAANGVMRQLAERCWSHALVHGEQHGYRNAQTTLLAEMPMVMQLWDSATPAAEPMQQLLCSVQQGEQPKRTCHDFLIRGLESLGYAQEDYGRISTHICGTGSLTGAPVIHSKALSAKGFQPEQLALLEEALPLAEQLRDAFDPWVLGESFCREQLGISDEAMFDAEFDMLVYLGFSPEEIAAANAHICGHRHVAGAKHIKADDAPVFACALNEENAQNTISAAAHIAMLAALSNTVSGGVHHLVRLPFAVTISDVETLIISAHSAGVRSLYLERLHSGLHMHSMFNNAEESLLEESTPRLVSLRRLHGPYRPSLEQLKEAKEA